VLRDYEYISGQLINLSKSFLYFYEKVPIVDCSRIRKVTGIGQGTFPFTYLGCLIFYGRRTTYHFEELLKKVRKRILLWQNKLLSFKGRYILVDHGHGPCLSTSPTPYIFLSDGCVKIHDYKHYQYIATIDID